MDEFKTFFEGVAVPLLLSMFGGIAKTVSQGWKSWRQFVGSLFVSGFAGVIVHLFIQDADISPSMRAAMVGLSGYSGVALLDGLSGWLQRMVERITGHSFSKKWDGEERRQGDRERRQEQGE